MRHPTPPAYSDAVQAAFSQRACGLARSPERIVTAQDLWEYAWGSDKPVNTESLHVYIYRLRNKLTTCKISIDTMVNIGYRLLMRTPQGTNLNSRPLI